MKPLSLIIVSALLIFSSPASFAGLVVGIENINLIAGGSGTIDVSIRSDSTDQLDGAQYKFQIAGGGGSTLTFDNPQDLSEGWDPFATPADTFDPNYVFFGDAFGLAELFNTDDTVTHADSPFGAPVNLDTTERLLVRLDVTHSGPVTAPEVFTISLVDDAETFFVEDSSLFSASFGVLGAHSTPVASGTVTVNAASTGVVPEPTSAAIFAVGLISVCGIRRRRTASS